MGENVSKLGKRKFNIEMILIILGLAWPTMVEQVLNTSAQYIDTAMVGALGTQATAAVGSTSTVNWLVSNSILATSIGFLSYISRACGAKNSEVVKRAVSQVFLVVLFIGSFLTILTLSLSSLVPVWMQVDKSIQGLASSYFFVYYASTLPRAASIILGTVLRAAGSTKTPMKIGLLTNTLHVIMNILLIYPARWIDVLSVQIYIPGANLGVVGAALSSSLTFTIGGILSTIAVLRHPLLSPKGCKFKPDLKILKPCLKVAYPNILQRFCTSMGFVVFASMINSIGGVATAAHTIANTVESAFYIPGNGMQTAAATLAGNAYGADDEKRMKDLSSMFIPIEIVLMIVSGAALFVFAPGLMTVFSKSEEVIALGSTVLRMVALSEPFYGFSIIIEGLMQGVGNTKKPFWFHVIGMWGVRILGTYICTQIFGLGLVSAWSCMIAHNLFLFVLFLICYINGSWNPLSTNYNKSKELAL